MPRSCRTLVKKRRVQQVQTPRARCRRRSGRPAAPGRVERTVHIGRVRVAQEVPGRVDERVHRVGVAAAGRPHDGQSTATHDVPPPAGRRPRRQFLAAQRAARPAAVVGHRHLAAGRAVHDRDRATPEPLPRDQPVVQRRSPEADGRSSCAAWSARAPASAPPAGHVVQQPVGVRGDLERTTGSARGVTSAPQRSQRPPTTCSLASTVWSTGHQLTAAVPDRPGPLGEAQEQPLRPAVVRRVAGVQPVRQSTETAYRRNDSAWVAMFAYVHSAGSQSPPDRPRSRRAARTSPTRPDAARRTRAAAGTARWRRRSRTPRRGPCAGRRTDRRTSRRRTVGDVGARRGAATPRPEPNGLRWRASRSPSWPGRYRRPAGAASYSRPVGAPGREPGAEQHRRRIDQMSAPRWRSDRPRRPPGTRT
jgi:hypothetical protein